MLQKSSYLVCLLIGVFLVLFQEFVDNPHVLIRIFGLSLIMFALYNITKRIGNYPKNDSFVEYDEEE